MNPGPSLHPRLLTWWKDEPCDPGRRNLDHPQVRRLTAEIAPGSELTDLGGLMSLNARLEPAGLVLRVHQPFVTRGRLLALQDVRQNLAALGLNVPVALPWRGNTVVRCGTRWAELETYVPHQKLPARVESYVWLFGATGRLHRALAGLQLQVPRPLYATYAPPGTLLRWLPVTEAAVAGESDAVEVVQLVRLLVGRLRARWVPATRLPKQLVHGDVGLGNVCRTPRGETLYLDFGFTARRPRVHDLAYTLAFMVRVLGKESAPETFPWDRVPQLLEEYEAGAGSHLTPLERQALVPYAASVPLYAPALAGFSADPVGLLRHEQAFLGLSKWLLSHPEAMEKV